MPNTSGPIQKEQYETMNNVARDLDAIFNGKNCPSKKRKWGFALFVFPFGEAPEGRMNYISNSDRQDMLVAMKEFIDRNEGPQEGVGKE